MQYHHDLKQFDQHTAMQFILFCTVTCIATEFPPCYYVASWNWVCYGALVVYYMHQGLLLLWRSTGFPAVALTKFAVTFVVMSYMQQGFLMLRSTGFAVALAVAPYMQQGFLSLLHVTCNKVPVALAVAPEHALPY